MESSCNHEEADTRLIVHLQDAILNGCHKMLVRTIDTDIVVIVIGIFCHLKSICQDNQFVLMHKNYVTHVY